MCAGGGGGPTVVQNPPTVTNVSDQDAGIRASRNAARRRQLAALSKQDTANASPIQGGLVDAVRKDKLGA